MNENKEEKEERQKGEYHCFYCGYDFEQMIRKSLGDKHSTVSDQVICPRCKNFLKTWDDLLNA